jgi:hypothetical protein
MRLTDGVRDSVESLFDHMLNDERFDRGAFISASAENAEAAELVDRVVEAMSPPTGCKGLEAGCKCWRCGQEWCEANYSKE